MKENTTFYDPRVAKAECWGLEGGTFHGRDEAFSLCMDAEGWSDCCYWGRNKGADGLMDSN